MLETFYEDLNKNPEDWSLRAVVADWYEDNGQLEGAVAQRWMVENRKRPYHGSSGTFTWFNLDSIDPGLGDPESDIPGAIYQHLTGQETANHKTYDKLLEAETDFARALTISKKIV
jgi:hypothetical protein